ncbi:MAG: phosphopantetheine-binding protein [Planctomycetota bacterium]
MADETAERTRKVIAAVLKVPPDRVTPKAHLVRELGMESIQSIELIAALEEEFSTEIDADKIGDVLTVEKAIAFMQQAVGK